MSDLKTRFRGTERIPMPDLWPAISNREPRPLRPEPSPLRRVLVGALALAIAVAGLALAAKAFRSDQRGSVPTSLSSNGKIAFARLTGSHWQIEEVNPDGTPANTLALVSGEAFHPAWSPDGSRIAFDVQSGAGAQIFLMDEDGTGSTQLTRGPGWNYLPSWSPDGTKIAFVSTRDSDDEIYVMNADGTDQVRLTDSPDEDLSPSWAPDSSQIVFQSNRDGNNEIYEMRADGTGVMRLTDEASFDGDPAWSPDGSRIAFASDRNGPGVYTMKPNGTDIVRLTHDAHVGPLDPAWSPDSTAIAFTKDIAGTHQLGIFVFHLSSRSLDALPGAIGNVCCPTWQPTPAAGGPTVAPSSSSAVCQYSPWTLCPEAEWIRSILRQAGISPTGDTGSAIVASRVGQFYVWSTSVLEEGPISGFSPPGSFQRVQTVDGRAVYSDGVRFVWQVGDLYVWLQSGEQGFTIQPDLVVALVTASLQTPAR